MVHHTDLPLALLGVTCLIALYLFFLLATVSIRRSRGKRLRDLGARGVKGYRYARVILMRAEHYLRSMQSGSFLFSLLSGYFLIRFAGSDGLWGWLVREVPQIPQDRYFELPLKALFVLSIVLLALVFVQFVRALANSAPERVLSNLALPIIYSQKLLSPIVFLMTGIAGRCLAAIGVELPQERDRAVSAEDISELVEMGTAAGEIDEDEQELIESVFTFSDTVVGEVMTPRMDVVSLSLESTLDEVVQTFSAEGFSRILITGDNLDDVRGVLLAKDLIPLITQGNSAFEMEKFLRKPFFVSHNRKIDGVLQEMQKEVIHFAVVLDEHGGVDGIVTLEDIIEELVGEIPDEFDSPAEENEARESAEGDLVLDASISIDDLNTEHRFSFPTGAYDTLAGFVIYLAGRIPHPGEIFEHESQKLKVEHVESNRITKVRLISAKSESRAAAIKLASADNHSKKQSDTTASVEPQRRISGVR